MRNVRKELKTLQTYYTKDILKSLKWTNIVVTKRKFNLTFLQKFS